MARKSKPSQALSRQIGERLRALRESRGIPRRSAAEALGLSIQTYTNRETGTSELRLSEILILSALFDVPEHAFFHEVRWPHDDVGPLFRTEELELAAEAEAFLRAFHGIENGRVRRDVGEAVRAIALADGEDQDGRRLAGRHREAGGSSAAAPFQVPLKSDD